MHKPLEKHRHILIISEDPTMRTHLQNLLSKNYIVTCLENGMRACDWLFDGNLPDLIISYLHMPEIDGQELFKILKESFFFKKIPFMILSTFENELTRERCLAEGVTECLYPSVENGELLRNVALCF